MFVRFKIFPILIFLFIASALTLNAQNLINNPGFENGMNGWAKNMNNGSSATFLIDTLS
jgi:hypothetical protein